MTQRIIKFRAWDKEKNKMTPAMDLITLSGFIAGIEIKEPNYSENFTWLEFTGLTDKNGKEIYESDLFDCIYKFDGYERHKLEVYWNKVSAGFFLKDHGECRQPNVRKTMGDLERLEVIGNIFSNPELLK